MFESQTSAAVSAATSIIQPTIDAINALSSAAENQYTTDQNEIADLQNKITSLTAQLNAAQATDSSDQTEISALQTQITQLQAQLQNLPVVFDQLEYTLFDVNFNSQVGGSGLGNAKQVIGSPGTLSLTPNAPASGQNNYFDCYFSQRKGPRNQYSKFTSEKTFVFPTSTDANASQALEFEVPRQIIGGKAYVVAFQLDFADKLIRYWNPVAKWTSTGIPLGRFAAGISYKVTTQAHRDANTVYYDHITIGGNSYPLNFTAPFEALNWSDDVKFALQLDGNSAGTPYQVKVSGLKLTLS